MNADRALAVKNMAYLAMYTPNPTIEQHYAMALYLRRRYSWLPSYGRLFIRIVERLT